MARSFLKKAVLMLPRRKRKPNFNKVNFDNPSQEVIWKQISTALEKGADINMTDKYGRTILAKAIDKEKENIVAALLVKGAKVDKEILMSAMACDKECIYESVVFKITDKKVLDEALLWSIANHCDEERIKDLVVRGANPNARGNRGARPLILAVLGGNNENNSNKDLIGFLINRGADPTEADDDGLTALGAVYTNFVRDKEQEAMIKDAYDKRIGSKLSQVRKVSSRFPFAFRREDNCRKRA
ncbi:MAG: hypothetical protein J6Y03_06165 [Alphaproteobacteria bacterium]|nr:hypothetical protein [Alphaproteobacteria bacterium]